MDRIVELIVRLIAALAGHACVLPGIDYARYTPGEPLKVLLAGYNGARNTGSDVRVAAIAAQLQDLFGPDNIRLSVMTLDPASSKAYFDPNVRQIPLSTVFFGDLLKACSEHHVAILCEGSTFKSTFADALTLYSCQTAGVMRAQSKPCIAYGSEVGAMELYLARAVKNLCTDVKFSVRSTGSLEALQQLGFDGYSGTDTAWGFDSSAAHDRTLELLQAGGWDGERPLIGIAPVNPFCWPVKPSVRKLARALVTGNRDQQYKSWYFFSWSEERERKLRDYTSDLAAACATFAAEHGFQPVVFGMEQLDAQACDEVAKRLGAPAPVLLSSTCDGYVMAEALRQLSFLVTSRYHAQVLATEALVPTVAVTMDERLPNLARELGCPPELLLHVEDADLDARVLLALDYAFDNAQRIKERLANGLRQSKERLDAMGEWLAEQMPHSNTTPAVSSATSL